MNKPKYEKLSVRCGAVISSCNTYDQLNNAANYCNLAIDLKELTVEEITILQDMVEQKKQIINQREILNGFHNPTRH